MQLLTNEHRCVGIDQGELFDQTALSAAQVVCAVQDGAEWLQGLVDVLRPDAVRILDFPHAIEHLTAAAQPVLGTATPELNAWLDEQAHALKHAADGARQVLAALGKLPIHRALDPTAAAEVRERAVTYLTKRLAQVRYATFQAAGYPIGSGSPESANKLVVEVRLKGSGMRWARAHVDPLVALRTVTCTNRWTEVWPCISARLRTEAELQRRARWRARHPLPTPVDVASPAVVVAVAQPTPGTPPAVRRGKSIVSGRPTALHPWKRFGYGRLPHAPGDLRFPPSQSAKLGRTPIHSRLSTRTLTTLWRRRSTACKGRGYPPPGPLAVARARGTSHCRVGRLAEIPAPHSAIENVPPTECEALYYRQHEATEAV